MTQTHAPAPAGAPTPPKPHPIIDGPLAAEIIKAHKLDSHTPPRLDALFAFVERPGLFRLYLADEVLTVTHSCDGAHVLIQVESEGLETTMVAIPIGAARWLAGAVLGGFQP